MRSLTIAVAFILGAVVTGCGSGAVESAEGSGDRTARPQSGERPPSLTTAEASKPPREDAETMPHGRCDDIGSGSDACATLTPNDRPAPDVVGMRVLAACERLVLAGYRGGGVVVGEVSGRGVGPGRVVSQDPRAGGKGFVEGPVELVASAPYPAEALRGNPHCKDATQYGPGARSNEFPNGKPNRHN